ncbi:hypothetical protein [Moraxella bovoculi]|uniref:hypothetical protein n=1 Tax=Moraxella bovoculi TaxID=386891 RepID=UPI000624C2D4|nr:hypothetical protein [Moraxella bovoculi]AKG10886.1 hypothetical protein AAX07_01425 [Moraxella bovoculi]
MRYAHMTRHDVTALAREHMHWLSTLITVARQDNAHDDTLLRIAEYLADYQYCEFDEMELEFRQNN